MRREALAGVLAAFLAVVDLLAVVTHTTSKDGGNSRTAGVRPVPSSPTTSSALVVQEPFVSNEAAFSADFPFPRSGGIRVSQRGPRQQDPPLRTKRSTEVNWSALRACRRNLRRSA